MEIGCGWGQCKVKQIRDRNLERAGWGPQKSIEWFLQEAVSNQDESDNLDETGGSWDNCDLCRMW